MELLIGNPDVVVLDLVQESQPSVFTLISIFSINSY